jgi:hypothetical protein
MLKLLVIILLSVTNKMDRTTIFFIVVEALNVSGGFPAQHQEFKHCTYSIWYLSRCVPRVRLQVKKFQCPQHFHFPGQNR